jgi:tripartite-type tricarboxylate transporter receptor subunit TctC
MASGVEAIVSWHTVPVKSIDDAKRVRVNVAATGPSSGSSIYPIVLNDLIGTQFKVVRGYAGTNEMLNAMERGEVDACGAVNVSTLTSEFPTWLEEKKINVLAQMSLTRHQAIPDVPTVVELAVSDRQQEILKLFAASGEIGRALLAPPELPPERVQVLRAAFIKAMQDPELLELARKSRFDISPMEGGDLQQLVEDISSTPRAVVDEAVAAQDPGR